MAQTYTNTKKKKSIKEQFLEPFQGLQKPDFSHANKVNPTILDKPIQAVNEFINPELKNARIRQEQIDSQRQAFADATANNAQANTQTTAPTVKQTSPEVIRDENGRITGVTFPDGRTLLGISPREVKNLINQEREATQLPEGAVEAGTARKQAEAQQQAQQAIAGLNAPTQLSPSVQLGQGASDLAATIGTSIPSIAGGAATGAGLGAAVGTAVAPVIGTTIGAVAGGVIGGITALLGKIAVDRRQATKEAKRVYTDAKNVNTKLLNLANSGSVPPAEIIRAYELNMANIREAERELRAQTRGAVGKQLSGAMDELIDVQYYLEQDGLYRIQLIQALGNPDPSKIYPTDEVLNSEDISN